MSYETFTYVLSTIGTIMILVAYFMVSTDKTSTKSIRYQLANLIGALFIGLNVVYLKAWPTVALEVAWILIATIAITKILINNR